MRGGEAVGAFERRLGIIEYLSRVRQSTYDDLTGEFDVSKSTVREDIQSLIDAHIPIEIIRGRYGGIRLRNNFYFNHAPMSAKQAELLGRVLLRLDGEDAETMQSIISTYAPHIYCKYWNESRACTEEEPRK